MTPTRDGAVRLFRAAGIEVFLHWTWFIVAMWQIQTRLHNYRSPVWSILEYLALFGMVLMHEFGHALACRQVGGKADTIVLWPLGGVAYVAPPPRPGAVLWSIAAGPLVNLLLAPILLGLMLFFEVPIFSQRGADPERFLRAIFWINSILLFFNMLPIYPLDGGQILQSILWYPLGRAKSLLIATGIGFAGVLALGALAYYEGSWWLGILAFFAFMNCRQGWSRARAMLVLERAPKREGTSCPHCKTTPPIGPFWRCVRCGGPFDMIEREGACPNCPAQYAEIPCVNCGEWAPIEQWSPGRRTSGFGVFRPES